MTLLEKSSYASLFIQLITGLIDIWGLNIPIPESANIFRQLLWIELIVQIIEFVFYIWLVVQFRRKTNKINNLTIYRYYDWFITTPSMLLTLMAYLDTSQPTITTIWEFIQKNFRVVMIVWILNWMMLGFGLIGELGWMDARISAVIGFVPFVLYYYIIYKTFIENKNVSSEQRNVFYYFLIVWSLYGVAALLPYNAKNTMYNILDLFAKNFFGLFLVYILYQKSKQVPLIQS
jgi:hypothetical protein